MSGIDQASLFLLILISSSFTLISFMQIFGFIWHVCVINIQSLISSNFLGTVNHLNFILLFIFTSSRIISCFRFSMEQMLMLIPQTTTYYHHYHTQKHLLCRRFEPPIIIYGSGVWPVEVKLNMKHKGRVMHWKKYLITIVQKCLLRINTVVNSFTLPCLW